ncbi:DM13 domain-containing protein [Haladaptatus sp. NG-SE-30]
MKRRSLLLVGLTVIGVLAVGYAVSGYFLPEQSTIVDEPAASDGSAQVLKQGSFSGKAGHQVSGTVSLHQDADGYYLRFENYQQTQGPDVYVYLTEASDPDTNAEIRAGQKVLIDGGAEGGESTKEGTFTQRLPADLDPARYDGVAIWCDRFSTPFGSAPLDPVE